MLAVLAEVLLREIERRRWPSKARVDEYFNDRWSLPSVVLPWIETRLKELH